MIIFFLIFNEIIKPKLCNFHIFKNIDKPPTTDIIIKKIIKGKISDSILSGSFKDKENMVLPKYTPTKGETLP